MAVFLTLMRSLPLDIDSDVSLFNLNPAPIVLNAPVAETTAVALVENTTNNPLTEFSNALEGFYNATDGTKNFSKVVDFLGNMAESESFKGEQTSNAISSASGIFHFLVGNGGGHTKEGKKDKLGQYDEKGVLRTSSFETAKKRLRAMIASPKWSYNIAKQPGLVPELNAVLSAKTPMDLSPQRQAILAYANLKMISGDFDNYLQGKDTAENVYAKVWVTRGKTHSDKAIYSNWKSAVARGVGKSNKDFFGIKATSASPHLSGYTVPYSGMHDGGVLSERLLKKSTLI